MFRTATTTAIAAIALTIASAGPAQAVPDDIADAPLANAATLAASIQTQINERAFGWQFAIAQDGKFVTSGQGGTALSAKDSGGSPVPMQTTTRMDIASATKTITAVATMKLLRANGLTIESKVAPYLPASWEKGAGFKGRPGESNAIRFRHLLAHTSGVNQALVAGGVSVPNGWVGSRAVVKAGAKADSPRAYHNHNYGLLRVLNAELYKRSANKAAVTRGNHAGYGLEHMRKRILEPAGLKNITCRPADPARAMKSYGVGAKQESAGTLHMGGPESCAGHRGIFLSTREHVELLSELRHGDIIDPDDLEQMDELRLGWSRLADTGSRAGAFFHGGDLLGTNQLHTCGATFEDGTEVSMMVNSPISGQQTSDSADRPVGPADPCGIVIAAWKTAM